MNIRKTIAAIILACPALFHTSSVEALTPRQEFESDAVLRAAKNEIIAFSANQLEATIAYIADCLPYSSPDRDSRCERASTILTMKTSRAIAFETLRSAIFVVDKVGPWRGASNSEIDEKLLDRRSRVFSELRTAAATRYESLNR